MCATHSIDDLRPLIAGVIQELSHALPSERADGTVLPGDLERGSNATRELDRAVTFVGASMAALGHSSFDLAAGLLALRDLALAAEPEERESVIRLFEWLMTVTLNSFATAGVAAVEEKQREQLAQGTPIVLVTSVLPALLLVGAPDRLGYDTIFSRLLLTVVRVGAVAVVIDANGQLDPLDAHFLDSFHSFVGHRKIASNIEVFAVGLDDKHANGWSEVCKANRVPFHHALRFPLAVADALDRSGYQIDKRD